MNDSNSNESRWKWFESVCKPKKQEVYFNAPRYETRLIFTYPRGTRSQIDRSPPSSIEYTRVLAVVSAHQIGTFHRGNKLIRSIAAPLSVYELLGAMHWKPARQRFRAIFLSILAVFLWPRIVEFVYQQNSSYSTFPRAIPSSFFTIISIYCDSN